MAWSLPSAAAEDSAGRVQSVAREIPTPVPPVGAPKPRLAAPTLGFRGWGIPWAPAGWAEGEKEGGVCRNERGRSRLLETNFTNEFCNN